MSESPIHLELKKLAVDRLRVLGYEDDCIETEVPFGNQYKVDVVGWDHGIDGRRSNMPPLKRIEKGRKGKQELGDTAIECDFKGELLVKKRRWLNETFDTVIYLDESDLVTYYRSYGDAIQKLMDQLTDMESKIDELNNRVEAVEGAV